MITLYTMRVQVKIQSTLIVSHLWQESKSFRSFSGAIAYESMVVWGMVGMVASEISGKVQLNGRDLSRKKTINWLSPSISAPAASFAPACPNLTGQIHLTAPHHAKSYAITGQIHLFANRCEVRRGIRKRLPWRSGRKIAYGNLKGKTPFECRKQLKRGTQLRENPVRVPQTAQARYATGKNPVRALSGIRRKSVSDCPGSFSFAVPVLQLPEGAQPLRVGRVQCAGTASPAPASACTSTETSSSGLAFGYFDMRLVLTSTGKLLISLTIAERHLGQSGSSSNVKLARIHPLQSSRVQDQTGVIASGNSSNVFLREYMPYAPFPLIGSLQSKLLLP